MKRSNPSLVAIALVGLACASPAGATTLLEKNLAALVSEADGVVVGTVQKLESHKKASGQIFTS